MCNKGAVYRADRVIRPYNEARVLRIAMAGVRVSLAMTGLFVCRAVQCRLGGGEPSPCAPLFPAPRKIPS